MKSIAFFNNKGGVGKTSLVYHLAWMFAHVGRRVVAVDLDPQSNLSSAFLDDRQLEDLWPDGDHPRTILGAIAPLLRREGDVELITGIEVEDGLQLVPGDLGLSTFEDRVSEAWSQCLNDNEAEATDGFRVTTAFHRVIKASACASRADLALIDVGPNIGALNRAALVASDFVVIPLGADLFSLQGLRNLGPTLRDWRKGWRKRGDSELCRVPDGLNMPRGAMRPIGYVLLNPSVRVNRPAKAYAKWVERIPEVYATEVLGAAAPQARDQLAMIKHFKSLMPMAQDARKPMFDLTAADGAIGGHSAAVREARGQFQDLAQAIIEAIGDNPNGKAARDGVNGE